MISKKLMTTILALLLFVNYAAAIQAAYTTIFAHGLGGQASDSKFYIGFVGCPIIERNGPEWNRTTYGDKIGYQQSCLAQDADIAVVRQQIEEHLQENIMLLGLSKGAATMINTVGWLAVNHPAYLNNIKAVILDAPFSCPETVTPNMIRRIYEGCIGACLGSCMATSCMRPLVKWLETKYYPHYNPQGITPIKAVTQMWPNVDKNMVVVFVHSAKDQVISINNSRLLYLELKKQGFINLYLIEASDGEHGQVFWGPERDAIFKKLYLIYLKHQLPPLNNKDGALVQQVSPEQRQQLLSDIQPSIEEVNRRLHL